MWRCMLGEWHVKVHAGRVVCRGACWKSGVLRCMLGEWRVEMHAGRVACRGACRESNALQGSKLGWTGRPSLPEIPSDHRYVRRGSPVVYQKMLAFFCICRGCERYKQC